jgi:hypothetical protein
LVSTQTLNSNKQNMKKLLIYISAITGIFFTSCTKDFDSVNTDPTQATADQFNPQLLLPSAEQNLVSALAGYTGPILFQSGWVQIFASTSTGAAVYYNNADKYVQTSGTFGYTSSTWNNSYLGASYANRAIQLSQDNPDLINLKAAATIIKVLCIQNVTDTYGDCPYTQAFQATSGSFLPAYDKQADLYPLLLSQLDSAVHEFDASKTAITNDLLPYKGNIDQWKKLGYSAMLKMAMRLTKVDAATAQKYAEEAVAGGTFASNADDAYIVTDNAHGFGNGNAGPLRTPGDIYEVRWSQTFINLLKANDDPRLGTIAEVPQAGLAENFLLDPGNTDPDVQIGLPNGYDIKGGATDISHSPGYPGANGAAGDVAPIVKYSRPRASIYTNQNAPLYILTYGETQLLLAEAKVRGWNVGSSTAAQFFQNGVSGGIKSLAALGADATISATDADTYAASFPLDGSSAAASLKQINEQYWLINGSFLNFSEAWSNWRRSGYPVLTPVNYTGNFSNGTIPRRQIYPPSESTLDPEAYQAAVADMGGDNWTTRVWWDK